MKILNCLLLACLSVCGCAAVGAGDSPNNAYAKWSKGPPKDASFFPIAVWLQSPSKAAQYREAGFNTYVGLWQGPTEAQLEALTKAGMKLICEQNEVGRQHLNDPTIIGWMHGDEPDNAQTLPQGQGYGPPITPEKIAQDYGVIRKVDPDRPVMLNLGQGVAWDRWYGRGVRTNHPEDYPQYIQGGDLVSFDIYPACHDSPEVAGKLWLVAEGVTRLVDWSKGGKVVWNCIECTRISHPSHKATPQQVRAEVWMSLIHGSMGLIYFVHEWTPRFNESALLSDPKMLAGVTAVNQQITRLAPVLNSPTLKDAAQVASANTEVPIALMAKRHNGARYVFAVAMREGETTATFTIPGLAAGKTIEVEGENRTLQSTEGHFEDAFKSWDAHVYRVKE